MNLVEQYSIYKILRNPATIIRCARSSDNDVYRISSGVHELICVHPLEKFGRALLYTRNTENGNSNMYNGLFARMALCMIKNRTPKAR